MFIRYLNFCYFQISFESFFFPLQVFFFPSIDFPKNRKKEEKEVSFPRQKAKVSTNTDGLA